jgi:hypothetical protein
MKGFVVELALNQNKANGYNLGVREFGDGCTTRTLVVGGGLE